MRFSPSPARILIVRLSHLGDVVHALPLFHALRAEYPDAAIGWAVQPEFADLVRPLPGLERVFHFERRGGLMAWVRLRSELMAWRPDWAIDAQGNLKSAGVTLLAHARRRSGYARSDWTEKLGARVLTDTAPVAEGSHAMQRVLTLAAHVAPGFAAGPAADAAQLRLDPALTGAERAAGARRVDEHQAAGGTILAVKADDDVRSWPREHWLALARSLAESGQNVLLLSGPAEIELGRDLRARLENTQSDRQAGHNARVAHWVGQSGLRELAAFFYSAALSGARLVACDSGPAHLAAAVGLPVDLLAGPQDPARTGPWPPPGRGAAPHRLLVSSTPPPCMPCLARRCAHSEGPVCLTQLTPESVAARLRAATIAGVESAND